MALRRTAAQISRVRSSNLGFRSVAPVLRNTVYTSWSRNYQTNQEHTSSEETSYSSRNLFLTGAAAAVVGYSAYQLYLGLDYDKVRADIADVLEDLDYDDGSYGPVLVRLAWHAAGTYSKVDKTGGTNGATMRFSPEKDWGANAGLDLARQRLESVKQKYPELSYADLWVLASLVAIEEMGGPKIKFTPGRTDKPDGKASPPGGRLPDANLGSAHIRDIFYRMGFNDGEIVALVGGGHAIGRCHTNRSGFSGPWTNSPTTFSNHFFVKLVEFADKNQWTEKKWDGPKQYEDPSGQIMMLPTDLALYNDPAFKKFVLLYAHDEDRFFHDFALAYEKLMNLGFTVFP